MRRTKWLLLATLLLGVAGCAMPEFVEEKVLQVSGIAQEESYQQYETLKREGKLDENGYYKELGDYEGYFTDSEEMESLEQETGEKGQVRVTFAKNSLLDIKYYFDEDCKNEITNGYCYLSPGESVYASQPKGKGEYANVYRFLEFRIFEYESDGNRKENLNMSSSTGVALTIPEDFSGTELAVEPIGEFVKTALSLKVYKRGENGSPTEISSGIWKVNGKEYLADTELSTEGKYTVTYEYDAEEYYIADTSPKYFSNKKGVVEFKEASTTDGNNSYSVELHPYVTLSLEGELGKIAGITIGNEPMPEEELEQLKAGKDEAGKKLNQLKPEDEVSIVTTDGYRLACTQFSVGQPESPNSNESRYTFHVPDTNVNNHIYVSKTDIKIDVDSKVGNDISFDIKISDTTEPDLAYQKKGIKSFIKGKSTLYKGTVGVEEQIEISAEGKLDSGNALRIEVTKTDGNNNKKKEIHYLSKVPDTKAVVIYENGKVENKTKIFKNIDMEISLSKDVEEYQQEEIENGVIELEFTDVDLYQEIEEGDIVEPSRKVKVIITPKEGYEISGKDVSENRYEKEMTYKKYKSQIKDMIDKHPIEKKSGM